MFIIILVICLIIVLLYLNSKRSKSTTEPMPVTRFAFPETDPSGKPMLKLMTVEMHGAMHIHDGTDPQKVIPRLIEGEELKLIADTHNEHDNYAVRVCTTNGKQIGWLPAGSRDVFNRLVKGRTVYARVKEIYNVDWSNEDDDHKTWNSKCFDNIIIEIARYAAK